MLIYSVFLILFNAFLINSLSYDGTQYRLYPRLDFTCINSTFSFEFNIQYSQLKSYNNDTSLLIYQDQVGKQKYFLLKLSKQSRLIFNDYWNLNKEIPIDLSANQWYKFIYKRKLPIGSAELVLQKQQQQSADYATLYQIDLIADFSYFGAKTNDYSYLFVGGLPSIALENSLSNKDVTSYTKFNGKIRNLIYSNIDTIYQQASNSLSVSTVSKTCTCNQLPKRQYALFNSISDTYNNDDICEADKTLCTKECACLSIDIDYTTNRRYKCDCLRTTSLYCDGKC